jgi:hypothetical protein
MIIVCSSGGGGARRRRAEAAGVRSDSCQATPAAAALDVRKFASSERRESLQFTVDLAYTIVTELAGLPELSQR